MWKTHKISFIFIFLSILLFYGCKKASKVGNLKACQTCLSLEKPPGVYIYPLKGGTPEWAALTDHDQKVAACQIPQVALDVMSTEALLQSCLDYPLLGDILLNVGVFIPGVTKYYTENFSGLLELSKRSDAGEEIYNRYSMVSPSCIVEHKANFSSSNFSAFETIIGEDNMLRVFSDDIKRKLVKEAIAKYYCKKSHPNNYAYYAYATSVYVMAKIMFDKDYQPFMQEFNNNPELQIFVRRLLWPGSQKDTDVLFETIIKNANLFIR